MGLRENKFRIKSGNSGTTNDDNIARRVQSLQMQKYYQNVLDFKLLNNFRFILISLSCHLPLYANQFENLCYSQQKITNNHGGCFID